MTAQSFSLLFNNQLLLKLVPISLRSLISLRKLPCDIYSLQEYQFKKILSKGKFFTKEQAKRLFLQGYRHFFIHQDNYDSYVNANQEELLKISRSLSVGDSDKKLPHQIELLNKNLELLYATPLDDELLQLQYRSVHNLAQFMLSEKKVVKKIYQQKQISVERYLFQQPFYSSVLLLGFLKYLKVFSEKDIQLLFMTSYLKDIGMSLLPSDLKKQDVLSKREKEQLQEHGNISETLLKERLNLETGQLILIKNHHFLTNPDPNISIGLETVLINIMDIFVATTSIRPYREADSPFMALELIKSLMTPKYATEFKYLVLYLKKILSE